MLLDTTVLSNGAHNLQVEVTDDLGVITMIGERRIRVNN